MVIDAAKGIEAQTRKLFEVCRLRDMPIITFINKLDRESRDPFELLDEIEKTLALDTAPVTWPVGRGRDFLGTYDVADGARAPARRRRGAETGRGPTIRHRRCSPAATPISTSPRSRTSSRWSRDACKPFDLEAFREGHLTPVFFGSALQQLRRRAICSTRSARIAPPPRAQTADTRTVEADEPSMTGFVFKIQANMDPNHRDRIAFVRLCSGKLTRGMKAKHGAHRQADDAVERRNSSSPRTARSPRRPLPATSSASPTTARCASATR